MPTFPNIFTPNIDCSAADRIDPAHRFETDSGVTFRRSKHSRHRRRYTVEWKGIRTDQMRILQDFVLNQRLETLTFSWAHPTAIDFISVVDGTPVQVYYPFGHGLVSHQYILITTATYAPYNTIWEVIVLNAYFVMLVGSLAGGGNGLAKASIWFPRAVAVFNQDTWIAPVKHMGPEADNKGYWSVALTIQEEF